MRIDIVSCVPDLLVSAFEESIMKRARDKGFLELHLHNLHDYAFDRYHRTDDYPFGGGAGMVMMAEPIDRCLSELKVQRPYDEVIYMTPDGTQWGIPVLALAMSEGTKPVPRNSSTKWFTMPNM